MASVKLNTRPDGPRDLLVDPGRFTATGVLLVDLIRYAYAFNSPASQSQVTGTAAWVSTTRLDIVATSKGQPTLAMLRALLEERFKVGGTSRSATRRSTRYFPSVGMADSGPRYPSTSTSEGAGVRSRTRRCRRRIAVVFGASWRVHRRGDEHGAVARTLGNFPAIGRVVIDRTGMAGVFDWALEWTPAFNASVTRDGSPVANPNADAGVSIFSAVREQLGLRLEPGRESVNLLVIEGAELPTPNLWVS